MRGSLFTVIIGQAGAFVNPGQADIFSIALAKHCTFLDKSNVTFVPVG